jgi:hypothetical protein
MRSGRFFTPGVVCWVLRFVSAHRFHRAPSVAVRKPENDIHTPIGQRFDEDIPRVVIIQHLCFLVNRADDAYTSCSVTSERVSPVLIRG